MNKQINERYAKISGARIPVTKDLSLGDEVIIAMRVSCVQEKFNDNQDGTKDKIVVLKAVEGIEFS